MTKSQNADYLEIGFRLNLREPPTKSEYFVDIEKTLIRAALECIEKDDGRIFNLLLSWMSVHIRQVNIAKLVKYAESFDAQNPTRNVIKGALYFAGEKCFPHARRQSLSMKTLASFAFMNKPLTSFDRSELSKSHPVLREAGLYVLEKSIRVRPEDVDDEPTLAKNNWQYRNRLLIGPNWRSDIVTLIELGWRCPMDISKELNCSYSSAHAVWQSYQKLNLRAS